MQRNSTTTMFFPSGGDPFMSKSPRQHKKLYVSKCFESLGLCVRVHISRFAASISSSSAVSKSSTSPSCGKVYQAETRKLPKIIFIPRLVQRPTTEGKELVPEGACLTSVSRQATCLSRLQMEAAHFPPQTSDIGRLD